MAGTKSLSDASDKWVRRAGVATPDYERGIKNPRRSWAEASSAANSSYVTGVTQAAQQGRYASGVKAAGDQTWVEGATMKGPARYTEGVQLAQGKWEEGFQPFHQALQNLQLPARGPRRSPQNMQRVSAVVQAMVQAAGRSK